MHRVPATRRRRALVGVASIVVLLVISSVVLAAAFDGFRVPTESMSPTLEPGDRVLARGIAGEDASWGEVVVFQMAAPGQVVEVERVSRVLAVEGDRIATADGRLVVNGKQVVEPYLAEGTRTEDLTPTTVPDGHVFVLSDNRANAQDSRVLGPIPQEAIHARVAIRWWPLADVGGI
jgi:signal peptidase I